VLIIVCGLPGSGKTIVAKKIAENIGGVLLRTDAIRKEIYKDPKYTEDEINSVYDEMFKRAEDLATQNKDVILEAVFYSSKHREKVKQIAGRVNTGFKIIKVNCDESILEDRINARSGDESDADFKIYLAYKKKFEPIDGDYSEIDNSGPILETYGKIDEISGLFKN
jgi:predicted kinase